MCVCIYIYRYVDIIKYTHAIRKSVCVYIYIYTYIDACKDHSLGGSGISKRVLGQCRYLLLCVLVCKQMSWCGGGSGWNCPRDGDHRQNRAAVGVGFLFFFFLYFFGCRAPGEKNSRQEATARIGRKEGRKEGGKEGSQEGRKYGGRAGRKEGGKGPYFCSHLRWKHWQQRYFLLNREPKPYGPKSLNHPTP